jgi:hypothetical protein
MQARYVILSILGFFFLSCSGKTEIIELSSLNHYRTNEAKMAFFVISNPPRNKDSLLCLIDKHFQSFAINDTIEKYYYYIHSYYKETWFTPRDYKEEWKGYFNHDYIWDHIKDKLIGITIEPKFNRQKFVFYKKGDEEAEIILPWKKEERVVNNCCDCELSSP